MLAFAPRHCEYVRIGVRVKALSATLAASSVGDVILVPTTIHEHALHGTILGRHLGFGGWL